MSTLRREAFIINKEGQAKTSAGPDLDEHALLTFGVYGERSWKGVK